MKKYFSIMCILFPNLALACFQTPEQAKAARQEDLLIYSILISLAILALAVEFILQKKCHKTSAKSTLFFILKNNVIAFLPLIGGFFYLISSLSDSEYWIGLTIMLLVGLIWPISWKIIYSRKKFFSGISKKTKWSYFGIIIISTPLFVFLLTELVQSIFFWSYELKSIGCG